MRVLPWMLLPLLVLGCRHHTLAPTLNGRPTQSLRIEARKDQGTWLLSMPLPLGTWTPEAIGEAQPMHTTSENGKNLLKWRVPPGRWSQTDRPFLFRLKAEQGQTIDLSVTYPMFTPAGEILLSLLAQGTTLIH